MTATNPNSDRGLYRLVHDSRDALVGLPVALMLTGIRCLQTALETWFQPADSRRLGICVACEEPVYDDDAFLRYRGEYYHGDGCVERDPPALRRVRTAGASRKAF